MHDSRHLRREKRLDFQRISAVGTPLPFSPYGRRQGERSWKRGIHSGLASVVQCVQRIRRSTVAAVGFGFLSALAVVGATAAINQIFHILG